MVRILQIQNITQCMSNLSMSRFVTDPLLNFASDQNVMFAEVLLQAIIEQDCIRAKSFILLVIYFQHLCTANFPNFQPSTTIIIMTVGTSYSLTSLSLLIYISLRVKYNSMQISFLNSHAKPQLSMLLQLRFEITLYVGANSIIL